MKAWVTLHKAEVLLKSGEYTPTPRSSVSICQFNCPTCNMQAMISKRYHSINYLGEIHPMVMCPAKCGFSNWVLLENWVPDAQGQA
jgi:hypothetical protein